MKRSRLLLIAGAALGTAIVTGVAFGVRFALRHTRVPDRVVPHVEPPPVPPPPRWSLPPRYRVALVGDAWQLVDEMDRVVFLRGVQAGSEDLAPPFRPVPYGDFGPFEQWKAWGFNGIRLLVPWEALEPEPGRFHREHLDYLRWFLDQSWRFGMAVVLVPFQYRVSRCLGGVGAPAWTHRPGVLPEGAVENGCRDVAAGGIRQVAGRWRWWTDFYENRWTPDHLSLQDHLIDTWRKVAEVLYHHPALLGYETLQGAPCLTGWRRWLAPLEQDCGEVLSDFHRRFAQAIRGVDRDALILVHLPEETPREDPIAVTVVPRRPNVDGIVLAATPPWRARPEDPGRGWHREDCRLEEFLRLTGDLARDHFQGPRILVAYGPDPGGPRSLDGLLHESVDIEDSGASAFVASSLLSGPPDRPGRPRCLAAALVRPFPVRVAGTDVRWSFDRSFEDGEMDRHHSGEAVTNTDVFTLTFRQGSSTADTLVFVPRFSVYGEDETTEAPEFTIDVSDGQWRWVPGEPNLLVWTTRPEVPEHRLVIRPWGGRRAPGNGVGPDCEP